MGKRRRAEDKGKGEGDDLIGIFNCSRHIHINVVCLIEDRLFGCCLCSAESTSVVAASAAGVLGAFAPEAPLVVRAGGVRTRGMGIRGRAEVKGKGEGDDLIGILTVVAISTLTWFA
jgi:hypothetical protein